MANLPQIIAHRGASRAEAENTLAAFRTAGRMGADAVELDVRRSRDGAMAVHHDDHLADGRNIVDDPEAVAVEASEAKGRIRLEVTVGPGDLGRVIGRRGRTAQSIRTVVRAAATRDGAEVDVDFVD